MPKPVVFESIDALTEKIAECKRLNQKIGVVPTMGALHDGHLSLVRTSLSETDFTVVTIFVNPTQFSPGEDLTHYPRTLESDLNQLAETGPVCVFFPEAHEIYPTDFSTSVAPPKISQALEGEFRPTHYAGVATVVLKLLNLTQADMAFFGQKDYQQQLVIKQMVRDLNVPTRIVACPIVREPDGLALSSRNAYLSQNERLIARSLNQTLDWAADQIGNGQRDGYELMADMRQRLIDAGVTRVDYATVAHPLSLDTMETIQLPAVLLLAATIGATRLIDNKRIPQTTT